MIRILLAAAILSFIGWAVHRTERSLDRSIQSRNFWLGREYRKGYEE